MLNYKIIYTFIVCALVSISVTFAGLSNVLKMTPSSGETFKYFCPETITVEAEYGSDQYQVFDVHVLFDSNDISVSHNAVNATFNGNKTGYVSGNLYISSANASSPLTENHDLTYFDIDTKLGISATNATFTFVDDQGITPSYNPNNFDDGINLTYGGFDTLSGVQNVTYNFDAAPCIDDTSAPIVYSNSWSPAEIYGGRLIGTQNIKMLVIDWQGSNGHYWYDGGTTTLGNYVEVQAGDNVDNQYGVNDSTIRVKIDNDGSVQNIASPTTVAYTGTETPNEYTWNSETRGYRVSFTNSSAFEVEKPVTITITGLDNPNYTSQTHLMTRTFNFNAASNPTITMTSPTDGEDFQSPMLSSLSFEANDSWAGVDSGSIIIEIPAIWSGGVGVELLMTGYVYSGSDLNITLYSGSEGLGNNAGYTITLTPKWEFPQNKTITVSGYTADLAGNTVTDTWTFNTRPSCEFYGCSEVLDVYIMGGDNQGGPFEFTGSLLIATGTNSNSPYPYLMGDNNDILMCGFPWTGANLTGNIQIFGPDGETPVNNPYTGNELYITGLAFTYSNGVIEIQD